MDQTKPLSQIVISIREPRLQDFLAHAEGDWSVLHGVNGGHLSDDKLKRLYVPLNKYNTLTRGEIGCYLSHVTVWTKMIELDIPYALICEDDCITPSSTEITEALRDLNHLDPRWNICLLARDPRMTQNEVTYSKTRFCRPSKSWGLFCYLISLQGARHLLNYALPIQHPIDTYVTAAGLKGKYALIKHLCGRRVVRSDTVNIR